MLDIGRIGGLGLLAIIDDADPRLDLALDDVGRGGLDRSLEGFLRDMLAAFAREDQIEQRFGARQAADMGGEEALFGHGRGLGWRKEATAALKAAALSALARWPA